MARGFLKIKCVEMILLLIDYDNLMSQCRSNETALRIYRFIYHKHAWLRVAANQNQDGKTRIKKERKKDFVLWIRSVSGVGFYYNESG
jgi:hypothetical protein